jgi:hypothetical protein
MPEALLRKRLLLAALLSALLGPAAAAAPLLECTTTYGGESWTLTAPPTTDPYRVAAVPVGQRFLFRMVWVAEPAREAGVNLYAYYPDADGTPVVIHQSKYANPVPVAAKGAPWGFTGLQFVYEPRSASEFQFWCGWRER